MIADFGSLPAFNSKHTVGVSKLLGLVYTGSSPWCPSETDMRWNAFQSVVERQLGDDMPPHVVTQESPHHGTTTVLHTVAWWLVVELSYSLELVTFGSSNACCMRQGVYIFSEACIPPPPATILG